MTFLAAAVLVAGPAVSAQAEPVVIAVSSPAPQQATDPATAPVPTPAPAPAVALPGDPATVVLPQARPVQPVAAPAEPSTDDGHIIVVEGETAPPKEDPLARVNAQTYEVTQQVDQAVVAPIAKGYQKGLPKPVRKGVRNFFGNLREPVVFLNFLLQGKVGKAMETVGRFALNSTVGVAGLFDVAKEHPVNLPRRNNGFANTLGFYGVKPGPYLVLPLVGSTTVRDLFGSVVDASVLPTVVGAPFNSPYYGVPAYTIRSLDYRIEMDGKLEEIRNSDDPYETARAHYLRERQAEIDALHGRAPVAPDTPAAVGEPDGAAPPVPVVEPVPPVGADPATQTPPSSEPAPSSDVEQAADPQRQPAVSPDDSEDSEKSDAHAW